MGLWWRNMPRNWYIRNYIKMMAPVIEGKVMNIKRLLKNHFLYQYCEINIDTKFNEKNYHFIDGINCKRNCLTNKLQYTLYTSLRPNKKYDGYQGLE